MNRAIYTRVDPHNTCALASWGFQTKGLDVPLPPGLDQKERLAYAAFVFCQRNHAYGTYLGAGFQRGVIWVPVPEEIEEATTRALRRAGITRERRDWFRWQISRSVASTFWPVPL